MTHFFDHVDDLGEHPPEYESDYQPCDEIEQVVLLRSQDADTEQCPLDPEEYQEGLGETTLVMVPLDPVRDESGQKGGVDDVEAGPCVPWVVRDVYEREQRLLQPVRGIGLPVRVQLVPEVYLSWQEEEEQHAEHRSHEQALDAQCQLHPPPVVPGG